MDVSSMESQNNFLKELQREFPDLVFKNANVFKFQPPKTIYLGPDQPSFALLTLHEVGHAISSHKDYKTTVKLLRMESEAWQKAKSLIKSHPEWQAKYQIAWNEEAENFAEDQLDTYRDYLHSESLCPNCGITRFQTKDGQYHCPNCDK